MRTPKVIGIDAVHPVATQPFPISSTSGGVRMYCPPTSTQGEVKWARPMGRREGAQHTSPVGRGAGARAWALDRWAVRVVCGPVPPVGLKCLLVRRCAGHVATLHNIGSLRSPRCTPLVCITTIRPREGESRKRNRSQLGVWASQRYDRECALVVSPEHPITECRHAGGLAAAGRSFRWSPAAWAAPLIRDLSRIHRVGDRRGRSVYRIDV